MEMDSGRGLSLPEEKRKDFQIQRSWTKPVEPIPTRLQQIQVEAQGSHIGRSNWLESMGFPGGICQETFSANGASNGASACVDSMASQSRKLSNWESAAMAGGSRGSGSLVDSHTEAMMNVTAGRKNIPFVDLLALTSGAPVQESSPFFPVLYSPSTYNQRQPNSAGMLLVNQDPSLNCEFWNKSNCQSQPQNGFPVPRHSYDLNSLPKTIADGVSNGAMSIPFAPVTPDKNQIQHQPSEGADLYGGERSYQEQDKQEVIATPNKNKAIELNSGGFFKPMNCINEVELQTELSHPLVGTSSVAVSTILEENHDLGKGGNNGIDLNKTPQQKPRRKKHRPKVVIEGKRKRTPKSATPREASDKQNPTVKRKYVRKKNLKTSETPPAGAVGEDREAIEQSPSFTMKSCRRVLNFNLDDQGRDEHPCKSLNNQGGCLPNSVESSSSSWVYNLNSESQAQDLSNAIIDGGSGTKSTVQLGQGVEVIVDNTSAGINYSMNHVIKNYISLPETTASSPQSTKRGPPIESSNCLPNNMVEPCSNQRNARNIDHLIQQHAQAEGISRMVLQTRATLDNNEKSRESLLQCGSQSLSTCQNEPRSNLHAPFVENEQTGRSKREYSHTIDKTEAHTMSMRGAQHNPLQAYQEIFPGSDLIKNPGLSIPEICKKRRTEKAQHTTTPSSSSYTSASRVGWGQALQSYHGTAGTELNNMLGTKGPKNGIGKSVRDVYAHSMATENCPVQNSSADLCTVSRTIFVEQQTSGFMLNFGNTERMTKKRSKGSTRVRDLASLIAIPQCTQLPSNPQKTAPTPGGRQGTEIVQRPQACLEALVAENHTKKKRTRKTTPPVNSVFSFSMNQVHLQENRIAMYAQHQRSAKSRGRSEIKNTGMVPIDEIVQRLKHLDINGETNRIPGPEQNALVPYNGNTTMVPYEGLFDPTRKRRPRPKVDLDAETNRVWKLLMGKEASEGMEQTDEDKEKWWEEERRVFRGRADSFIARMHLVQGDRRFSQWKGSVVDSVVGVFLTQNVSDHLSSSAFMSLAARFPLQSKSNEKACCKEEIKTSLEESEVCIPEVVDTIKWHEKMPSQLVSDQSSMTFHETGHIEEREVDNSNESFGSNMGDGSSTDNSRGKQSPVCRSSLEMSDDLLPKGTDSRTTHIGMANFTEEDRRALDDALSSQNSTESSTFQITERNGSCSDSNSEAEDLITHSPSKPSSACFDGCTFTQLLQMGGSTMFQEFYNCGSGSSLFNVGTKGELSQSKGMDLDNRRSTMVRTDCSKDLSAHNYPSNSYPPQPQVPIINSSACSLHVTQDSGILEVKCPEMLGEERKSPLPSLASEITETIHANSTRKQNTIVPETVSETTVQKVPSRAQAELPAGLCGSLNKHQTQTLCSLPPEPQSERDPKSFNHQHRDITEALQTENSMFGEPKNLDHTFVERQKSGMNQVSSSPSFLEVLDVERRSLADQEKSIDNKVIQSNFKEQVYNSATGTTKNLKAKKLDAGKKKESDWDSLRKQAYANVGKRERSSNTMDSLDWDAVRCADVNMIANAIKERGMNNMLAERIKDFLNRLVREHEDIDLEWLRDVPPDQTKEFLLSIRGLGLKSVECVRLLTLHHLAFPVDTNVGRIAVRLGWVPLQPLPESLQLHLLEMYPMLESIQKYLWPRLCTLDQRTLYELHYQMITFGKVFCTKSKPNCNACPMRGECKHFASAFASARFALPAPEEKSIVSSTVPVAAEHNPTSGTNNLVGINTMPLPLLEAVTNALAVTASENRKEDKNCEPIVEVPASPEPECPEISQSDIEDFFDEDPDEIPTIKLNVEEFTMNLQNYMHSMELEEGDMSKALVSLTPETASIPVPKLKNVSRLRTEHQVYELPDSHHLLKGMDKREPDDPCSYLLAIWTPGETAESIEPPRSSCGSQESGELCNEKTCFSCNSIREANSQTVRGTLLIPCRTAMRGSFPLNGTYFQVNEVFADHDSSVSPIDVPRSWLWNLPRRTVYFGTSIPTIFKGLTTEGIQHCFWRGFVCVRGFDQKSRAPRPLMARLHFPASKLTRAKDSRK